MHVHISDCDKSARTTTRTAGIDPTLVSFLTDLAGYDGGVSQATLN